MRNRLQRNEGKKTKSRTHSAGDAAPTQSYGSRGSYTPDLDGGENNEMRPWVALWRAVLVQNIMDAKSRSSKPEASYYRHKALHFLFDDNKDFRTVCDLADLNPDVVRQKLREARERGFIWRAGDGQTPTKHDAKRADRIERIQDKRAILIEFGLFPKLEVVHAPRRRGRPAARSRFLGERASQFELSF